MTDYLASNGGIELHMKQHKHDSNKSATVGQAEKKPATHNTDGAEAQKTDRQPKEYGGRKDGLDPTRFGDWEKNGRCIDF